MSSMPHCASSFGTSFVTQTNLKEVIELRDAIVSSASDLHRPINLMIRIRSLNRSEDVNRSLMALLSDQVGA